MGSPYRTSLGCSGYSDPGERCDGLRQSGDQDIKKDTVPAPRRYALCLPQYMSGVSTETI
jgi:hypothetical protein